jgi:hypothetical protein
MTVMGANWSLLARVPYVRFLHIPVIDVAPLFPVRTTNRAILPVLWRTPENMGVALRAALYSPPRRLTEPLRVSAFGNDR